MGAAELGSVTTVICVCGALGDVMPVACDAADGAVELQADRSVAAAMITIARVAVFNGVPFKRLRVRPQR